MDETSKTPVGGIVIKEIPPFERESPVEEPLFINHCQVARYRADAYIDVGVIPLDDVLSPQRREQVRFIVLSRLVMSLETLTNLRDQITSLLLEGGDGPTAKTP